MNNSVHINNIYNKPEKWTIRASHTIIFPKTFLLYPLTLTSSIHSHLLHDAFVGVRRWGASGRTVGLLWLLSWLGHRYRWFSNRELPRKYSKTCALFCVVVVGSFVCLTTWLFLGLVAPIIRIIFEYYIHGNLQAPPILKWRRSNRRQEKLILFIVYSYSYTNTMSLGGVKKRSAV